MNEQPQLSIRADVYPMHKGRIIGTKVAEVVVTPGDLIFAIHTTEGCIFRAPLGELAYQLAIIEPRLARYLVPPCIDTDSNP